ncbi:hypothetical protein [Confluentibacter flavum]|uniref:Lipoprotein n=1 Tax=Confluentibacter flavum TaxID=1909700 RepID=A0A2N3HLH6_9FLAO|nr:hypothetical protein [Confluentibacter flavum]PKQ45724.1 hypothetical protein CSW08_06555 [Confluentibacter flavum]
MKTLKKLAALLLMTLFMVTFSQCSSAQKLQKETPFKIGDVYYQAWNSGINEGSSGVNIFINIVSIPNNITLDSIYFQGKKTKLELETASMAVGRFKIKSNRKQDIIMSNAPYAEYGNKVPKIPEKIPFELKDNECIVSYQEDGIIKYFKIKNIIKKEAINHPITPNNN